MGSGVIVPGGCPPAASCSVSWIVTNYHVVSGENSVTVKFASGLELSTTEVVASDPDADLAVLKLDGAAPGHSDLGDSDSLAVGQRIFVISSPLGLQGSVTEGLVSAIREIRGARLLQISAPISPGSSGGPVFDQDGKVVGIATATMEGAQNVNMAIPSSTIQSLLRNPKAAKLAELSPQDHTDADEGILLIRRRASAYLSKDMTDEAEAQLRAGIQQYEFDSSLRLELAKLLVRTGRNDDALQQLRIVKKLAPSERLATEMIGHLFVLRWRKEGRLSDRETAFQIYQDLVGSPSLPRSKRESLEFVLKWMVSPAGEWETADSGRRKYNVLWTDDGPFSIGFTEEEDKSFMAFDSQYQIAHYGEHFAYTLGLGATFSPAGGPGKFQGGEAPFLDAFCFYNETIQVEISPNGSTMKIAGTITEVTGVERYAVVLYGKKSAAQKCRKPGAPGIVLVLSRLATREYFLMSVAHMLEEDTLPLAVTTR
jgi:hypothetical protein